MSRMKDVYMENLLFCYNCGRVTEHAKINGHMICLEDDCFEQTIEKELKNLDIEKKLC